MNYTLGTAAKAAGTAKSTILRAIKSGKFSAERNAHGQWSISASELHRVYPPTTVADTECNGAQNDAQPAESVILVARAVAEAERDMLRGQVAELREQRDAWQGVAERLALTAPKPKAEASNSLWRWLRSTG